jgi:Zn-dependent peptidase ImmA (M78 family)
MSVRRKHIRTVTEQLLARHQVQSAPVPVEKIARSLGLTVRKEPTEDDLSGFLVRDRKKGTAIIGVNARHHPNRQNFTVAHELGHFLLHEGDAIHVDRRFQVKLRNEESSKGTDLEEKEANLFAAELLMPKSFLEGDLAEIGEFDLDDDATLTKLAKKYGVSTQALTIRLGYLGYVEM